jgi:hypothetical protein
MGRVQYHQDGTVNIEDILQFITDWSWIIDFFTLEISSHERQERLTRTNEERIKGVCNPDRIRNLHQNASDNNEFVPEQTSLAQT